MIAYARQMKKTDFPKYALIKTPDNHYVLTLSLIHKKLSAGLRTKNVKLKKSRQKKKHDT